MVKYTLIFVTEDGDVFLDCLEKDELLSRLDEGYYGPLYFLKDWPSETFPVIEHWDVKTALLIKGEVVVPKPKEQIIKHEID